MGFLDNLKAALGLGNRNWDDWDPLSGADALPTESDARRFFAGRYDAKAMRTRTLQGIINTRREKEALDDRTRHVCEIYRKFTEDTIKKIDEAIAKRADGGSMALTIALEDDWLSDKDSKTLDGLFDVFYIEISDIACSRRFENREQHKAYALSLALIIGEYYKKMGYSVHMGERNAAEKGLACHRRDIVIDWGDDEMRRMASGVTDEFEVIAYAKGLSLDDILLGKGLQAK